MRDHIRLALMMASTAMFTLAGYELMRSASTVLFKQTYGAENLPMVMAVMPLRHVFRGVGLWAVAFGSRTSKHLKHHHACSGGRYFSGLGAVPSGDGLDDAHSFFGQRILCGPPH